MFTKIFATIGFVVVAAIASAGAMHVAGVAGGGPVLDTKMVQTKAAAVTLDLAKTWTIADTRSHFVTTTSFDFEAAQRTLDPVKSLGALLRLEHAGLQSSCFNRSCRSTAQLMATFERGHARVSVHMEGSSPNERVVGVDVVVLR